MAPVQPLSARVDYGACVERCEGKFRKVSPTDRNCDDTLGKMTHDILVVKSYLETTALCSGRFKVACEEWKNSTVAALGVIAGAIGTTPKCMNVTWDAMKSAVWPFLPDQACTGDGTYTDFHDFMRNQESVAIELSNRGLRYPLENRDISPYDDLEGHAPNCGGGLSPINRYVKTYLDFGLALLSLEGYQACMMTCQKPTPEEEKLWGIRDRIDAAHTQAKGLMDRLKVEEQERQQKQIAETTVFTPCSVYGQNFARLKKTSDHLKELKGKAETLETAGKPELRAVLQLESEATEAERTLSTIHVDQIATECRLETEQARELEDRKRKILSAMTSSKTCSLAAVEAFGRGKEQDAACQWTSDCAIPGICVEGACQNPVKLAAVRPVLEEAHKLAAEARALHIVTDKGLSPDAATEVQDMEQRRHSIETRLQKVGWDRAVDGWREEFRASLRQRVSVLSAQTQELMDRLDEERTQGGGRSRECTQAARDIRGLRTDLQRALAAVEKADPIVDAVWVRQRSDTLDDVERRLKAILPGFEGVCQLDDGGTNAPGWWLWLLIGTAVVAVTGLALRFLRRRKAN
jgi:hypothetical protein